MKKFKPRNTKQGPEKKIQEAIIRKLRYLGWFVLKTHGNMYQSGFPDLYCTHSRYGIRWVEVKLPDMKGSRFTPAQLETFPKLSANGTSIWILTGDDDSEIQKLFKPANWYFYWSIKS